MHFAIYSHEIDGVGLSAVVVSGSPLFDITTLVAWPFFFDFLSLSFEPIAHPYFFPTLQLRTYILSLKLKNSNVVTVNPS